MLPHDRLARALLLTALALLVSTGTDAQPSPGSTHGSLRWVRARVTAASPLLLTLQLREAEIQVQRGALPPDAAAVGSTIELHYVDSKGVKRAVFAFPAPDPGELSKRPGRSLHGVLTRVRKTSLQIDAGGSRKSLDVESRAVVVDAGDTRTGRAAVIAALTAGDEVLVKYAEQSSDIPAGDVLIPGTDLKALEVRRLGRGTEPATAGR